MKIFHINILVQCCMLWCQSDLTETSIDYNKFPVIKSFFFFNPKRQKKIINGWSRNLNELIYMQFIGDYSLKFKQPIMRFSNIFVLHSWETFKIKYQTDGQESHEFPWFNLEIVRNICMSYSFDWESSSSIQNHNPHVH